MNGALQTQSTLNNGLHGTKTVIAAGGPASASREYRRGQIVFDARRHQHLMGQQPYRVVAGEVVIVRNGSAVDIVEPGEYLDPSIWQHATAIAWTDCRVMGA